MGQVVPIREVSQVTQFQILISEITHFQRFLELRLVNQRTLTVDEATELSSLRDACEVALEERSPELIHGVILRKDLFFHYSQDFLSNSH